MFTIPVTYTLECTYPAVSILHTFRVTIPTLILNAIISHHILTMDTAHISALQNRLQAAAVIDRACSLERTGA